MNLTDLFSARDSCAGRNSLKLTSQCTYEDITEPVQSHASDTLSVGTGPIIIANVLTRR